MKKICLVITLAILTICTNLSAQNLTAEWTAYVPPTGMKVIGFSLYQTNVETGIEYFSQFYGETITTAQILNATADKLNKFELTANFADGTESPKSSPFYFYGDAASNCAFPITASIEGGITHIDYGGCPQVTAYKVDVKNANGNVVVSFIDEDGATIEDTPTLPDGNYTIEVQPIKVGTIAIVGQIYATDFVSNTAPAKPLAPTAIRVETSGVTDTQTVIASATVGSDADMIEYEFYSVSISNIPTLRGTFTVAKGANIVKTFTNTSTRGYMVKARAVNSSTAQKSVSQLSKSRQIADQNGDGMVTAADKTQFVSFNNKACASWVFATKDLSTLVACQLANMNNDGTVNSTDYPPLSSRLVAPQSTVPIIQQ